MTMTTADYLRKRDAWMREVLASAALTRSSKLTGLHIALRLSHKSPSCYPAMKSMGRELGVSVRQIARDLKELEGEKFLRVRRRPGTSSLYSLDL